MRQELKEILSQVFVGLTIFLIVMLAYKSSNPYAYSGIETMVLFILVPMGIVLLYLYLREEETYSRLSSRIIAVVGEVHYSRYMRFCQRVWQMIPPLIRIPVSKGLTRVYTRLNKFYLYLLNKDLKNLVSYAFLGLLLIVAVQSIAPQLVLEWGRTSLQIATVAFGIFTIYLNRDKLENIEEEIQQEEMVEKRRKMEFPKKYPRINRLLGVRWVARGMYKEGWWYSTVVIILLIVGVSIRLYRLGELSLWWDEIITGTVVTRIRETGLPLQPSGFEYYWRGVAYHYFVVLFTYPFGPTEFAIRLPSLLFGMGIVFLSFLIGRKIDRWVGLLVLIFMTFSTFNIEYSRFARFYVMNAFLFMLSILFVYEGFFKDRIKYKIISMVIFLIMMHTVQLGRFFIFVMGGYFVYEFIKSIVSREKLEKVKQNKINLIFLGFALIILQLGNLFENFFSRHSVRANEIMNTIVPPDSYPILKYPEWNLLKFMDEAHIPIAFIFVFLIFITMILLKNIKLRKNKFLLYISVIFFSSMVSFEFLNRNVIGARIYLIFEGVYVILSLYLIYLVLKISIYPGKISKLTTLIIIILFVISIKPNFYERITIDYGDNISYDPFRTTDVAAYRADYETQHLYIYNNLQIGDIWISVIDRPYFYINKMPDYIFNQNYRWNTYALLDEDGNFRNDEGSVMINKVSRIKEIIKNNPDKKVWLVVNGGSINILTTIHVREDFLKFLEENKDKIVYRSPDKYSIVLLFNYNIERET